MWFPRKEGPLRSSKITARPLLNVTCPHSFFHFNASLFHMCQIVLSSHHFMLDTIQVLSPSPTHQHNIVLLKIVALSWYVSSHFLPVAETDTHTFSIGWVRFPGLFDKSFEHNAFEKWLSVSNPFTQRFSLWRSACPVHLVECSHASRESFHSAW